MISQPNTVSIYKSELMLVDLCCALGRSLQTELPLAAESGHLQQVGIIRSCVDALLLCSVPSHI